MSIIYNVLLLIDGAIYDLIDSVFDIFNFLTKANLFDNQVYSGIVRRVYIVLGMIMMFALAYSLLKAIINPDEFSKGEYSFPKLIKNVVISLAIIAVLPTIFTVAFNIQNSLINQDTIPKLVLGDSFQDKDYNDPGRVISYNTFAAFLHVNEEYCKSKSNDGVEGSFDEKECASDINTNKSNIKWYKPWRLYNSSESFYDVSEGIQQGASFINYNQFGEAVSEGKLSYLMIVSTICGLFLLYVLVNFCFDMALRVIKLMFFQIIAPIPVVCRVIPGGKMKDVFSTWTKKTVSTFIDVFIRIFIMYLGIFIIITVTKNWPSIPKGELSFIQSLIAKTLIIMGVVIFIRQAPKLLADMFHLDIGDMKLGIMDKLAMGGAFAAGSIAGGAFGTLGRNAVSAVKGFHDAKGKGFRERAKALGFGAASIGAGTFSGAVRGFNRGKGAKNLADMKKAAGGAVATTSAAKAKRDKYRAAHTSPSGAIDTLGNVMWGHLVDTGVGVAGYFGVNNVQDLIDDNKQIDDINSKKKAIRSAAEDLIVGESNKQGVDKSFGLAGTAKVGNRNIAFSTATLRSMRQQMEIAKSSGAANAGALQDDYDTYLKQFTDAVQNQALLGTHSFDRLLSSMNVRDAKSLEADLGDVRNAASDFRKSIRDNINATYIVDSGFTMDMVDDSNDLRLKDNAMDVLGDTLKIAKNRNNTNLNNLQQKKENSGK